MHLYDGKEHWTEENAPDLEKQEIAALVTADTGPDNRITRQCIKSARDYKIYFCSSPDVSSVLCHDSCDIFTKYVKWRSFLVTFCLLQVKSPHVGSLELSFLARPSVSSKSRRSTLPSFTERPGGANLQNLMLRLMHKSHSTCRMEQLLDLVTGGFCSPRV